MTDYPEPSESGLIDPTQNPAGSAALVVPGRSGYLQDPPEVGQHAKRGDPPMDRWRPGVPVKRRALMESAGDPRDWFRYGHRFQAYQQAWYAFMDARRRRFDTGFEWNQILVLGDYGVGNTSVANKMARYWSPVSEHEPATCEALYCQLSNATGVVHD